MNAQRVLLTKFRLEIIVLILLASIVLTKGMTEAPLVDWDEATYAEVTHEAVANHSYLDFTWNGERYLKKPPLLFWTMAASFNTVGESEFAARLPSVVMGIGTLLLMYAMVAEVFGRSAGLFAGLVPLGFYFFVARGGRECGTDAPLVFFSTLTVFALGRMLKDRRWNVIAGAACGLAILSKGAAGFIPLLVVVLSLLFLPAFCDIGIPRLLFTLFIAAAVAAPWFIYQVINNGPTFWSTYVKQETLMRIARHLEDNPPEAGYTWRCFITEVHYLWPLMLPLAGLAAAGARQGLARLTSQVPAPVAVWSLWLAAAFSAACAVQTKLGWYVLPALIPAGLLAAAILAGALRHAGEDGNYCRPLALTALILLCITAAHQWSRIDPNFAAQRARSQPSYEMARRALAFALIRGGGELYFAGAPLPTMVYYSRMRCHFVSPSEPEFELADLGGNPISVSYEELVLRDPTGAVTAIDNFHDEWNESGPESERAHHRTTSPHEDGRVSPE